MIEQVIELPEYLTCAYHGDYSWRAYYEEKEMLAM